MCDAGCGAFLPSNRTGDPEQERQAATAERDAIARDREALAQDHATLDARQKRQDAEIELLARGADDSNGLDLRPHERAFIMKADVMTEKEKLVYKAPWTAGAVRIGHQLAIALQRIRRLTADLLRREGRMMVQEKELARWEAATIERDRQHAISAQRLEQRHVEQDAAMALAKDQLAKREQVIAARENALEPREAAIQQQSLAASEIEAAAEEHEQAQRDWMTVVSGSADGSLIGSLRDDGYFHMAWQIDGRPRPAPDAVKRTIANRPLEWAATMFKLIDRTFRDQADTSMSIMKLNYEVDARDDLVQQTRKSLPQNQQQILNGTDETLKEVAERLRRMEAIQSQQRSL